MPSPDADVRRRYLLRGVVQGVGFRPQVATVASRHQLTGLCGNDEQQVFIEAQAAQPVLDEFWAELIAQLPPLARVVSTQVTELPPVAGEVGFQIVASQRLPGTRTLIPPDVATCDDCLAEMADAGDRRWAYPFTNCTNCGPRLSIITDLPYDRPATTLAGFAMCAACQAEYTDPTDRRFHAQPISCPDCGPRLWLDDGQGELADDRAPDWVSADRAAQQQVVAATVGLLRSGKIVAVKGIGGFHLLCDARNPTAVRTLRERKRRSAKPFAVMVAEQQQARRLASLGAEEVGLLTSPARPIVIAPISAEYDLCPEVAPGLSQVGLVLAYAPLHHLLLGESGLAVVATSGNLAEEPLCHTNPDARARLGRLADAILLHDRPIHVPVEDSVFQGARPVRRSRGYAPLPVALPTAGPPVLGVGGELKNTVALASGEWAHLSAHIGEMGSLASQFAHDRSVAQLVAMRAAEPEVLVADLHPGYATTGWAERYQRAHPGVDLVQVQHHLAHGLALLCEHQITAGRVVVAALDGTGYGCDATIWGGELLGFDLDARPIRWARVDHVPTFGLVGGDRAIRHPWRVGLGVAESYGLDARSTPAWLLAPQSERRLVESQLASGNGVVASSSVGRLFDAAAALLGVCQQTNYEAQAAILLEEAASGWQPTAADRQDFAADLPELFDRLISAEHLPAGQRAWRFHQQLAGWFAERLSRQADLVGTRLVGLTGGVLANRLLSSLLGRELSSRGLDVLTHRVVPANDGGLSLGQVWAGRLVAAGELELMPQPAASWTLDQSGA